MNLKEYIEIIIEPTFADFCRNPDSGRHAFLACVAAFHAVDRVTAPRSPANLRKIWGKKSLQFLVVDMVAHHFKHVRSNFEKQPIMADTIALHTIILNHPDAPKEALGLNLRHLRHLIRDAIKFIRQQAELGGQSN